MQDSEKNEDIEFLEDEDFSGLADDKDKIKKLRNRLSACEDEKKSNLEGWQRSKADLINFKKEVAENHAKIITIGSDSVIQDLLPIIDAFYAAMQNKDQWHSVGENWRKGIEYIHSQLMSVLSEYGATLIVPQIGEDLDESLHDVVSGDRTTESPTVAGVTRPGLVINEKIVRPAQVTI